MPSKTPKRDIEDYERKDQKRIDNPPVGLVTPTTGKDAGKKTNTYDPHLYPMVVYASKKEHKDQTPESEILLPLGDSLRVHKKPQINWGLVLNFLSVTTVTIRLIVRN